MPPSAFLPKMKAEGLRDGERLTGKSDQVHDAEREISPRTLAVHEPCGISLMLPMRYLIDASWGRTCIGMQRNEGCNSIFLSRCSGPSPFTFSVGLCHDVTPQTQCEVIPRGSRGLTGCRCSEGRPKPAFPIIVHYQKATQCFALCASAKCIQTRMAGEVFASATRVTGDHRWVHGCSTCTC